MTHSVRRSAVELEETNEGYVLSVSLPGVKPDDLEVSTTGQRITVVVEPRAASDSGTERTFELPERALLDEAFAKLERGVLRVVVPRRPGGKPRRIPVAIGS